MRRVLYILGELSDADVEWMITYGRPERLATGTLLIQEGEPIEKLYILLEGQLVVLVEAQRGRELGRPSPGEVVGEVSLVDARPASATVKTASEVLLLSIPHAALKNRLQADANFAARFYRALAVSLAYRLRDTNVLLGYEGSPEAVREIDKEEDELDLELMDKVYLAGQRFERILKRLSDEYPT